MPQCKSKKRSANRVVINVGGQKHETFLSTLRNIPDTRLYNLSEHHTSLAKVVEYDSAKNEYFFDRHPQVFAEILNYYRTGKLHCPGNVCGPLFESELEFWGIDEEQVEMCCWESYKQHREKQEKLKYFRIPHDELEDTSTSQASELFEEDEEKPSKWSRIKFKVWRALEEPYSSKFAKAIGITSLVIFTAFIIKFTLSTLPYFHERQSIGFIILKIIHVIAMVWFTLDFVLRAIVSPNKVEFLKRPMTWVDMISLVPMYMFVLHSRFLDDLPHLEMLVMLKVARIFQLFKLSYVIQVLTNTLKASSRELCLLLVIMGFQTVVFSSILYFLERKEKTKDYISVPHSMWWTIITMTTVGYGDVYPRTWFGKIIGSVCAICGVLVIALPVSVVATNFSLFYTYAKARLNIPPKKKRVALAHALTAMRIPRVKSSVGDTSYTFSGNRGSPKFSSICSTDGRRDTTTAHPSPVESEMSLTPTLGIGGYKKFFKDSHLSLHSVTSLRPPEISYNVGSRSLNSLPPELSKEQKQQKTREDIMFRLDPPSRASSFVDIATSKMEGTSAEQKKLLGVPGRKSADDPLDDSTLGLNPFLLPARLRMRRGAISMASLSLKSASSNSSYLHWPTSKDGLEDDGPFIILPTNFSLQSLSSLKSGMNYSCSSLKSLVKDALHAEKKDKENGESVITIPVPVLRQPKRNASTSTEPEESEFDHELNKDNTQCPEHDFHSTSSLNNAASTQRNTPDTSESAVKERDMVYLVFPADVSKDKKDDDCSFEDEIKSEDTKSCCCFPHDFVPGNGNTLQPMNCKHLCRNCNLAPSNNINECSSEKIENCLKERAINADDSVFLDVPLGNSNQEPFNLHENQTFCLERFPRQSKLYHASTSCLGNRVNYDQNTVNNDLRLDDKLHYQTDALECQTLTGGNKCFPNKRSPTSPTLVGNGCLRYNRRSPASCPVLMHNVDLEGQRKVEKPNSLQEDMGNSSIHCNANDYQQIYRTPLELLNRRAGLEGNCKVQKNIDCKLCNRFNPHFHTNERTKFGKHNTTSV